ncbi:MAG: site-2 protease family protein [Anaerolineae bacterium]|nr:site-2 protease family protein [Anaerolineae bacterium]MBT7189012.1 site-2 protease family protein [Anaerolineae bacterium]MBT7990285.1 site-2 protease family protein [Anaerolineae bacterium]
MTFIIVLVGWIFSLSLHEFAHALVAYYGGDTSVRDKGYLTFNPLKYTHPLYSIALPLLFLFMGGIGLPGGAVYIETWRLRSAKWRSAVSLAGPSANIILVIVIAILLQFAPATPSPFWAGLAFLALLQIYAVVLNLIPVPPFDGFGIIEPYLSPEILERIEPIRGMMIWLVIAALWYVPFISNLFSTLIFSLAAILQIPFELVGAGYQKFFFWKEF